MKIIKVDMESPAVRNNAGPMGNHDQKTFLERISYMI